MIKDKIIDMIKDIENEKFLKFTYDLILAFKKKWGI